MVLLQSPIPHQLVRYGLPLSQTVCSLGKGIEQRPMNSQKFYKFCLSFSEEKVHGPYQVLIEICDHSSEKLRTTGTLGFGSQESKILDSVDSSQAEKVSPIDLLGQVANHKTHCEHTYLFAYKEMICDFSFYF